MLSGASGPVVEGWAAAAAGVVALLAFVAIERRRGERAIMPLALFGTASFVGLTLLTFFLYAALGGLFVLLPYLLIELHDHSPVEAGATLLPLPAVIGLASRAMGAVAARTGPRAPLTIGPLVVAAGFVLAARIGDHVGTANGFNSAVARTGGLIATALLGAALAARGEALADASRWLRSWPRARRRSRGSRR